MSDVKLKAKFTEAVKSEWVKMFSCFLSETMNWLRLGGVFVLICYVSVEVWCFLVCVGPMKQLQAAVPVFPLPPLNTVQLRQKWVESHLTGHVMLSSPIITSLVTLSVSKTIHLKPADPELRLQQQFTENRAPKATESFPFRWILLPSTSIKKLVSFPQFSLTFPGCSSGIDSNDFKSEMLKKLGFLRALFSKSGQN